MDRDSPDLECCAQRTTGAGSPHAPLGRKRQVMRLTREEGLVVAVIALVLLGIELRPSGCWHRREQNHWPTCLPHRFGNPAKLEDNLEEDATGWSGGCTTDALHSGAWRGLSERIVLDVNRANMHDLQTLPGIGPGKALRVISWREAHGPFASPDDLIKVSGIGPVTLSRLRPLVVCGGSSAPH